MSVSGYELLGGRMRDLEVVASSEIGSSRQVMDESVAVVAVAVEYDVVFVAVGKEVKKNKSILIWGLHNSKGKKIYLVYVHVPAQMIPMPMGGKFPASRVGERELKAFRDNERKEMLKIQDEYLQICIQTGAHAEKISLEANSIEEGIVTLISQYRIGRLVMGAAAENRYSRKMVEPKSTKAKYVCQHAPDFCRIWFVCKGHLIYTRKDVEQPSLNVEKSLSNASESFSDVGSLSSESSSTLRHSSSGGYEENLSEFDQSQRVSFSTSSFHSSEAVSAFSSPRSSFDERRVVRKPALELLALPNMNMHLDSSPPSVLESSMSDDLYDRLDQAMTETENSKREALEESMRRGKAQKEAFEAIRKAKAVEKLYYEEWRQRKYVEEELVKGKKELEIIKSQRDKVSQELSEASDQKLLLESEIEKSNLAAKELEEKILSAVELLQKYKDDHRVLQIERDNALREAEELRKQLANGPSSSLAPKFFSEFSFSDLEKATNSFDRTLKIGKGGFGNIFKGFLRNTEVAIKILHHDSLQGPQEFQQEVDVLSKLRHPNLVTLIGACPESWALVYEYLRGGNLDERLNCKDNTPPLSWQTRIRIAAELCSVLIFLHSSQPSSVIHGDLKPANILLDDNSVCKLSDFGICRVISNEEMEQTKMLFTEPKGTFTYMDPEFLQSGELTTKSDVYSFGIILLRLLTGKSALGIIKEVQYALDKGNLSNILDLSAGDWPFVQAEQLANMAMRCCDLNRKNRPDLALDVWRILEPMKASCGVSTLHLGGEDQIPFYFICPVFQEIMQDPHIAADGFTYEAEAIKGWLDSGHDTSPMTNVNLTNHDLIPNRALRSAIQEWLHHHQDV